MKEKKNMYNMIFHTIGFIDQLKKEQIEKGIQFSPMS